jgi:transposase
MALRTRAVEAYEQGEGTQKQVAQRFKIGLRTLQDWLDLKEQTDSLEPRPAGGGRNPAFDDAAQAALRQAVQDKPDATLEELQATCGVACSRQSVCATLQRLGLPRKKNARTPRSKTGRT